MGDAGYIVLALALAAAVYSALAFVIGARRRNPALTRSARNGLLAVLALVSLAIEILLLAILTHNFTIDYVASISSRDTPFLYLITGLWAGNEGSLLFWAWLLSLFAAVVMLQKRKTGQELLPYAAAVMMATQAFFLVLLLFPANPFRASPFPPPDGVGLNPLLENPGMIVHPPALLAGYVSLTIPFAFAIAALLTGRLGDDWIISVRRWTLLTWLLLGAGNIIGAWWAYVELGWGGYWAWDPVENAGLMPWLVVTAFLHSIMMQRRRGMLKIWNMVLIILAFSLAIFGTFLTRSGILSSVHAFADAGLGTFFLIFLVITLLGSLGLLYFRRKELKSEAEMESIVSKESTFLLNNLLFVGAAFAIFLGTVFPLISEAVRGVKISLKAPFFNQVNGPIFLAVILLTGACVLIGWRRASARNLVRSLLWPFTISIIIVTILSIIGVREWYALGAFFLMGFAFCSIIYQWYREVAARSRIKSDNVFKAFWDLLRFNRPRYGGYIAHVGILLLAIGITGSSLYEVEAEAILMPGESMSINNYTLIYQGTDQYSTPGKMVVDATLAVHNGGELIAYLVPEKYMTRQGQAITEVAIRSTPKEDLYVILIGANVNGSAAFKVLVNPLVSWIWLGGWTLMLGGLISFWPERQRQATTGQPEKKEGGNED